MQRFARPLALRVNRVLRVGQFAIRIDHRREKFTMSSPSALAAPANLADLEQLTELNREYVRSVQESNVGWFDRNLAEDFMCSNPDASLVDRTRFLKQTAAPVKISHLEAGDVIIRLMGDFAIIHARTSFKMTDGRTGSGRYTDVWARREGRWVAVSAHVTRAQS
jgi:hypothetical protein